jgi:quercetin dioxygenase-like cupin family protein
MAITTVGLDDIAPIPLPNGSWSRMLITKETTPGVAGSLGYSVFTPGTATPPVSHNVEEIAFVVSGRGELRLENGESSPFTAGEAIHIPARVWHGVANTGEEDLIMVFGFPWPGYPPTEKREAFQEIGDGS